MRFVAPGLSTFCGQARFAKQKVLVPFFEPVSSGFCSATGGVVPGGLGTCMPPGGLTAVRSVPTHVAAGRIH